MESSVFLLVSLFSNVIGNGGFGSVLTNCTDIVAITPELAAPQFFLDTGYTSKDFTCRNALDSAHDFSWAVGRHRLHETMNMIPICTDLQKDDFVALGDIQTHRFQDLINFFTEDDSSVFRWTYEMV